MSNLEISPRALQVIRTSIQLFDQHGFHGAGIDFILEETKIAKMTFYKYFKSKEKFIEQCLTLQKIDSNMKYFQLFIHAANSQQSINSRKFIRIAVKPRASGRGYKAAIS